MTRKIPDAGIRAEHDSGSLWAGRADVPAPRPAPLGGRPGRRACSAYSANAAYSVAMASRTGIREARSAGHRAAMTPTTTESTSMPTIWPQGMLRLVSP